MMNDQPLSPYRVWLYSAPGLWATYDGHVDVFAAADASNHEIFTEAVRRLARESFPDRPSLDSWRLERIERLPRHRLHNPLG